MKRAYPTFIAQSGAGFLVYVPDMEIYTEGSSLTDAIEMARDAIGLKGIDLEDDGKEIPAASDYDGALKKAGEDVEDFDYRNGVLTMVDVDFTAYRMRMDNKMVRRNVTLPNWLNLEAERLHPVPGIHGMLSEPEVYDFLCEGVSKAEGIRHYVTANGDRIEQTVVFGDSENDLEMIQKCGVSVSMKNGTEAVRAAADYVTGYTNNEDGVFRFLKEHEDWFQEG